ncbi:MAG: epoxide hydrolase N-terminal domain-containing protein, partial [Xanthobacteraceae bacterium]|nr:epoxide hydrolase N-terminal domain-containing protein [Xanthobacteraceae bacterium]
MLDPRSFTIAIDSQRLERLKARIIAYDWTAMPDLGGWAAGPPTSYMRALAERWVDGYDWREVEARRNRLPQFLADIDGQTIHYIHIRGSQSDRPPLLLLHGWPGSVFEFEETIEAIRRLDDSFDIIVPAMPGYGFSLPLHRP